MKRFNIFATMALAMVLGLGAAIGIGSGTKEVRSAEAADKSTAVYLKGGFNGWAENDSTKMYYAGQSGNNYFYYLDFTTTAANQEFKVNDKEHGGIWCNNLGGSAQTLLKTTGSGDNNIVLKNNATGHYVLTYGYNGTNWIENCVSATNWLTLTKKYSINGVDSGSAGSNQKFDFGATLNISGPTAKSGYTFSGWYWDVDCNEGSKVSASAVADGWSSSTGQTSTIYAKMVAATSTVSLNKQGGTGGSNSVTATYGSAMPSIDVPTRNGYTFQGYYDNPTGGTLYYYSSGTSAKNWDKTGEQTLYARWASTTSSTFRLWFYRNGHYQDGYIWKIWDGVEGHAAYEPQYIETYSGSGNYLLYYDLSTSVTKINFQIFTSTGAYEKAVGQINYSAGKNAYLWTADVSTWNTIHQDERLNYLKASPSTIATALSAYYSCSSDANNGYGNAAQLYKTWVYTGTTSCVQGTTSEAQARNAIANVYMEDYSEQSYTDPSKRTQQVTLLEKLTMMMNNQNPVNSRIHLFLFGKDAKTNNSVIIVIVSSLVAIGAFAGYFFYKKKKEDR